MPGKKARNKARKQTGEQQPQQELQELEQDLRLLGGIGSNVNKNGPRQQVMKPRQQGTKPEEPLREMRILMLHGYAQSGATFHAKTRGLEKILTMALKSAGLHLKLVYPTAPHRLSTRDVPGFAEKKDGAADGEVEQPADTWAWYRKEAATGHYVGLEQGMMRIAECISGEASLSASSSSSSADATATATTLMERLTTDSGGEEDSAPIEGVIGFSQGACMAALLAAAMESDAPPIISALLSSASSLSSSPSPSSSPSRKPNPNPKPTPKPSAPRRTIPPAHQAWVQAVRAANRGRPLRFAIVYGGFAAADSAGLGWLYAPMLKTPTMHVIGTLDTVVGEEQSRALAARCDMPVLVTHPGGHFVPVTHEYVMQLVGFIVVLGVKTETIKAKIAELEEQGRGGGVQLEEGEKEKEKEDVDFEGELAKLGLHGVKGAIEGTKQQK